MAGPVTPDRFAFRALGRKDLQLLGEWLTAAHVAAWWQAPADLEHKYFGSPDTVRRFIAHLDDRPIGMIQLYWWADSPHDADLVGAKPGEVGIDYLIGDAGLTGRGVGPPMIEAFLTEFVSACAEVIGVRVDVAEANHRSWRALEKLGFTRRLAGVVMPGAQGPHYVYVRAVSSPQDLTDPVGGA